MAGFSNMQSNKSFIKSTCVQELTDIERLLFEVDVGVGKPSKAIEAPKPSVP